MPRIPSANPYTFQPAPGEYSPYPDMTDQQALIARHRRLPNLFGRMATTGVLGGFGAALAPLAFSGGAAQVAPQFGAYAAAPPTTTGAGMTFGNLLRLGELGAGLTTSVLGNRSQGRALDRDAAQRAQEFAQQQALLQRQQDEGRRQWEAEQAQRAQEFALAMEDRTRRIRLEDEREQRRAPYRAMAEQARLRMADLLRLGRR